MEFPASSVAEALEVALAASTHLTERDAATVAAARALAAKIDAWDVIVQWALDDAREHRTKPTVPANDNTSLGSFLRYMEVLQLAPAVEKSKPGPASTASSAQQAINDMRKGLSVVS